jgi:unsaturated rhamnogalacturonyl hydrolase
VSDLVQRVAATTATYPFKVWGFGESIAMQALMAAGSSLPADLLTRWAHTAPPLAEDPLAHVAPGVPLLDLYARTGDPVLLARARELATMLESTKRGQHGARIHRPDLAGWDHEVWVDCMHLDVPFLGQLANVEADDRWRELGIGLLLTHARVLQDERSCLFSHGFDDATGRANGVFWGRGQGWALLGLVDTLLALPAGHEATAEIRQRLCALVEALVRHEVGSGRWHTVVDAPETYVEASVGAFVALGVGDAVRAGVMGPEYDPVARRALDATVSGIDAEGALRCVSDATPVGPDAAHYHARPIGVFPWGQGPALLALKREVA